MIYLSKSKYCGLWQCPKLAWLRQYKPEEAVINAMVQARFDAGNVVGDLAMGLFGDFVEVTTYNGDKLDLTAMIEKTESEMQKGTENIAEASFSYNGLYCAVDILKKENGGWAIYEVKSSTKRKKKDGTYADDKEVYVADIAYQKYVLEHCGVNVTGTYLVCLNGDYVFDGTLDLKKLFYISDVSGEIPASRCSLNPTWKWRRKSSLLMLNRTLIWTFTARTRMSVRSGNTAHAASLTNLFSRSTVCP